MDRTDVPPLRPRETAYNSYLFRSRLEARWAVYYDDLGIEYQYELQGFDLGDAGHYLPDFYLYEWRCYAEVKPPVACGCRPCLTGRAGTPQLGCGGDSLWERKAYTLACGLKGTASVLLLYGDPGNYRTHAYMPLAGGTVGCVHNAVRFGACRGCHQPQLAGLGLGCRCGAGISETDITVQDAVVAARSARFDERR